MVLTFPCSLLFLSLEMGLGKTVQCVSLFEHLRRVEHISGPFLVVVPLGTISHWKREFESWTDMNCLVYHDAVRGKETRRLIRETEIYYQGTKQIKFNVLITTYEVLIGDVEELSAVNWMQVIVDEGHRIKNKSSKILEALQLLSQCRAREEGAATFSGRILTASLLLCCLFVL